jgi:hypothetical protein
MALGRGKDGGGSWNVIDSKDAAGNAVETARDGDTEAMAEVEKENERMKNSFPLSSSSSSKSEGRLMGAEKDEEDDEEGPLTASSTRPAAAAASNTTQATAKAFLDMEAELKCSIWCVLQPLILRHSSTTHLHILSPGPPLNLSSS